MKKTNLGLSTLLSMVLSYQAQSFVCPVQDASIPACPKSGSSFLAEDFPIKAVIVSTQAVNNDEIFQKDGKRFVGIKSKINTPASFIMNVIKAHNYKNLPPIVVPTEKANFDELKQVIAKHLQSAVAPEQAQLILEQLVHVEAPSYTWQQDYFESFLNPKTGTIEIRNVAGYNRFVDDNDNDVAKQVTVKIAQTLAPCGVALGADLPAPASTEALKSSVAAEEDLLGGLKTGDKLNVRMGGAIEGLPGGLCLVSSGQDQGKFTNHFCDEASTIKVNTDWLVVGHVDEVVKLLPRANAKNRCDFDVMVASPKLGLKLLKENAEQALLDLSIYDTELKRDQFLSKWIPFDREDQDMFRDHLCDLLTRGVYGLELEDCQKNSKAFAQKLKNGDIYKAIMKDPMWRNTNMLAQDAMDQAKRDIEAKLAARMPECGGRVRFIDVPNVFIGYAMDLGNGKFSIEFADAISIFPNPTNSVYAKGTMIFPDPHQANFKSYLNQVIPQTGNKLEFVDTWNYAHVGLGNMHCSSHVVRYCR